jgi:hypothetical protein
LDKNYPKNQRGEIKKIYFNEKVLEGKLNLSDFVSLESLNCSNNLLTDVDLTGLNQKKLESINLRNNNLSPRDLTCFSNFINLKEILIDTDNEKRAEKGTYNRFRGSLEPLKNLTKLNKVIIANTDVDSGLEYLPESVRNVFNNDISFSFSHPSISSPSDFGNLGCRKICELLEEYFPLGINEI